jgi:hypothetical protein
VAGREVRDDEPDVSAEEAGDHEPQGDGREAETEHRSQECCDRPFAREPMGDGHALDAGARYEHRAVPVACPLRDPALGKLDRPEPQRRSLRFGL